MSDGDQTLTRDGTFSARTEILVREMILDGTIPPGERLNEVAIATALGISRGPLREAIQRLAGEGLVKLISHRGAFVRTFEKREVDELYDLRCAYEMFASRLVCERATDEQLAELDVFVAETGHVLETEGAYPRDLDFHTKVLALSGNQALTRLAEETQAQISLARSMSAKAPVRARQALNEHAAVVAALQARSADEAAKLAREHLENARRSALMALGFDDENEK